MGQLNLNAKKIYQKHLDMQISDDEYLSPKQLESLKYEATMGAMNELIDLIKADHSNKYTIISIIDPNEVDTEDGGKAKIFSAGCEDYHDENGMFVKIQSWDENLEHSQFNKFLGKRVKITIEEHSWVNIINK